MSDTQEKDSLAYSPVPETKNVSGQQNISIFKGNEGLLFAFKKSQKLAAAIYLVTDLVPEEEVLRQDLRRLAVSLVKDILSAASLGHSSFPPVRVVEITSLIEIASSARLISAMNAEVLRSEYDQVLTVINRIDSPSSVYGVVLTDDILKTDVPMPSRNSVSSSVSSHNYSSPLPSRISSAENAPEELAARRNYIGQYKGQDTQVTKERSLAILELIKKSHTPLSIKDITTHVRGVGEKTIQRELGALVAKGVLKREGERRWSRYSLR